MEPALSDAMTTPSLIFTETMMVTAGFLFPAPCGPAARFASARRGTRPPGGSDTELLQEARHPTGRAHRLPHESGGRREHDEGCPQRGTEQDAVLLQIGEGDQ